MKPNRLTGLGLLLLALLATGFTGMAQERRQRSDHRPMGREVCGYVEANVQPVVRQQRQKLESQLSAADRADLATYRAQLQDNRARSRTLVESLLSSTKLQGERPEFSEAQVQQLRVLRTENREIMQRVRQMAQKYSGAIEQLMQEMQPQRAKWSNDIKAIVAKTAPPVPRAHTSGHHMPGAGAVYSLLRPSTFLLSEPGLAAIGSIDAAPMSSGIYPNPVVVSSQFDYQMKATGPITVDLLNNSGQKLRTLVAEPSAAKGHHTWPLNLSDLPAGTYYYKVMTQGEAQTKRFVKE